MEAAPPRPSLPSVGNGTVFIVHIILALERAHVDPAGSFHVVHMIDEIGDIVRNELGGIGPAAMLGVLAILKPVAAVERVLGNVLGLGTVFVLFDILTVGIVIVRRARGLGIVHQLMPLTC